MRLLASTLVSGVLAVSSAAAQVPTALIMEGGPVPGAAEGQLATSISQTAVNHDGGYAVLLNTSDGGAVLSTIWGAPTGGDATVVRVEGTFGTLEQTAFESFFGIGLTASIPGGDPAIVSGYSPTCNDTGSGAAGLDSAWMDDVPVAVEDDPYPHEAGQFWSFASRVGCLADGTIVFVGGTTDTPGGSTQVRGIFHGTAATPILVGGDTVPGLPVAVDATGIDFDFRFSAAGTHYVSPVSAGELAYLVVSGAALEVDGVVVGEGNAVPEVAGGLPGELWDNFDFVGVTEQGVVFFTGDTNADIGVDEFVFLDDGIVLREGDVAGAYTIAGAMEGGYLNADGDYAVVWDVEDPEGDLEALIVNGQVVAVEGDPVDLDGDGVAEEGTRIDNFTGISSLTLGDRHAGMIDAYVTIDVEIPLARPVGPIDALALGEEAGLDPGAEVALLEPRGTQVLEGAFRISVPVENVGVPDVATSVVLGVSVTRNPVPVGDVTTLVVDLSREAKLSVDVVGIDGRRVTSLDRREAQPGRTSVRWDHTDSSGRPVAAGAYWLVAEADGHRRSTRVTVLD